MRPLNRERAPGSAPVYVFPMGVVFNSSVCCATEMASWQLALRWMLAVGRCLYGRPAADFARDSAFFETEVVPLRSVPAYHACFAERAATFRFVLFAARSREIGNLIIPPL
jgi:hypothetical protein